MKRKNASANNLDLVEAVFGMLFSTHKVKSVGPNTDPFQKALPSYKILCQSIFMSKAERIFSFGGIIIHPKRRRLEGWLFKRLLILKGLFHSAFLACVIT